MRDNEDQIDSGLVNRLRMEASSLKECFTNFAFAGLTFSSAVLGFVVSHTPDKSFASLASVWVVGLLLTIARIGTHKYSSANRLLGYELHLHRTKDIKRRVAGKWTNEMGQIGWEEGMRAWRVVMPPLHDAIYKRNLLRRYVVRKAIKKPRWFEQDSLLPKELDKTYHAGDYLRNMLRVLFAFAFLSMAPMFVSAFTHSLKKEVPEAVCVGAIAIGGALFVEYRRGVEWSRMDMLEDGLLSIHSTAIVWQLVCVAHAHAREIAEQSLTVDGSGYQGYTHALGNQGVSIAGNAGRIYKWFEVQPDN